MNYDLALFEETAARFGLSFSEEEKARLDRFAGMVLRKNEVMNLTNLTAPEDVAVKHLADSLLLLQAEGLPESGRVLDVGTGAGFPAVPLAIARPGWSVTALDATRKKIDFLEEVRGALGVPAACVQGRAEALGKESAYREQFDLVTARAVAPLYVLAELCLPMVKPGGCFAAMKGASADAELAEASRALRELGGELEQELRYALDASGEDRRAILLFRKVRPTPAKYPRPYAKIKK